MKLVKTALITGASMGLGRAMASALATQGWNLIINARQEDRLRATNNQLSKMTQIVSLPGDVGDKQHRLELARIISQKRWILDLVINNASTLGLTPMPHLLDHPIDNFSQVLDTNLIAPIALLQKIKPLLSANAKIINVSSDAAIEPYAGWGAYSASKAGLDHLTAILQKENPSWSFYAFDPGDMRTTMYQLAFPNEDISDRPLPDEIGVPALLSLIANDLPSGRYSALQLFPSITEKEMG